MWKCIIISVISIASDLYQYSESLLLNPNLHRELCFLIFQFEKEGIKSIANKNASGPFY